MPPGLSHGAAASVPLRSLLLGVLPRLEGGVVDLSEGVAGCWEALLDDFDIAMASLIAEIQVSASSWELQMISIDLPGTLSTNPYCSSEHLDRFERLGIARIRA